MASLATLRRINHKANSNNKVNPNQSVCAQRVAQFIGVADNVRYLDTYDDILRASRTRWSTRSRCFQVRLVDCGLLRLVASCPLPLLIHPNRVPTTAVPTTAVLGLRNTEDHLLPAGIDCNRLLQFSVTSFAALLDRVIRRLGFRQAPWRVLLNLALPTGASLRPQ